VRGTRITASLASRIAAGYPAAMEECGYKVTHWRQKVNIC